MCLLMSVIFLLATVCLHSARISAGRVKAANAVDTGLYSLFSEYQRILLEEYDLFFLDAGYGQRKMNQVQLINQLEYYMKPMLGKGLSPCSIQVCAIEGYRIASDESAKAVKRQMIRYVKENLGNTGIELLKEEYLSDKNGIERQKDVKDQGISEEDTSQTEPMENITERNNPLDIIKSIRENGFLGLVLPAGQTISEKNGEKSAFLSHRELQQGRGEIPLSSYNEGISDRLFLTEYALEKLGDFTNIKEGRGLDYQVEYLIGGKENDRDNLKSTVNRLIAVREISNLAFLYQDSKKRAELKACAAALSLAVLIPEGMELVQAFLAAGWAYAESICDVKILLGGGEIPLVKSTASWKTQLNNLSDTMGESRGSGKGLDYRQYLRLLLMTESSDRLAMRCMDMIEMDIRTRKGQEGFSFDSCIDMLAVDVRIKDNNGQVWSVPRTYGYDMYF